jgi:glycosyltransferase involved in cell wall biosynthesis
VYFTNDKIRQIKENEPREKTLKKYGLATNKKYIGVFGFLSPYKGHLTVLKALDYLDDDYEVVIVGAEHPRGLTANEEISNYVSTLLQFSEYNSEEEILQISINKNTQWSFKKEETLFEKANFKHFMPKKYIGKRVNFVGAPTDEEMPAFFNAMDYVVLAHIQTSAGQAASGPAVFALEFRCNTIFSNASVFRNLEKFYPGGMNFFNVGNFKELALKINTYGEREEVLKENLAKAFETYNAEGMIKAYIQHLDFDIKLKE